MQRCAASFLQLATNRSATYGTGRVKSQIAVEIWCQIVGQELNRMDHQAQILDQESQKVRESLASHVQERLGETEDRQARQGPVISQLHERVQGTGAQSMHWDLLLDQEILRLKE